MAEYADIIDWLCPWLREQLEQRPEPFCEGVEAYDSEPTPAEQWPERLLVLRDDGGTRSSIVTGTATVGITVYAGTRATQNDARDLARVVAALLERTATTHPENPITGLRGTSRPYRVAEDADRGRYYLSATFTVAATLH